MAPLGKFAVIYTIPTSKDTSIGLADAADVVLSGSIRSTAHVVRQSLGREYPVDKWPYTAFHNVTPKTTPAEQSILALRKNRRVCAFYPLLGPNPPSPSRRCTHPRQSCERPCPRHALPLRCKDHGFPFSLPHPLSTLPVLQTAFSPSRAFGLSAPAPARASGP